MQTKQKISISKIVFYACATLMTFSIFMFFMENLKWNFNTNVAIPSFFDLMFGGYGSPTVGHWPVVGGMVVLFIFQIALSITCFVIAGLLCIKKISKHTAICVLCGMAVLAAVCGVLALCSKLMIDRKSLIDYNPLYWGIDPSLKDKMTLNYGAYVYGITMILSACGSVAAFVLDHYNK